MREKRRAQGGRGRIKAEERAAGESNHPGYSFSHFRVEEFLRRGASADVYRAYDLDSDREVALRLIRIKGADPELLRSERLGTELQMNVSNIVPQVAKIFEAGESEGIFYTAGEWIEGESLNDILETSSGSPLPPGRAISIAIQLCQLLEVLQHFSTEMQGREVSGIVHGDIKPSNIVIAGDFTVRLLDFGVAKSLTARAGFTTNIFASLPYAAPERLRSGRVDLLSDLWSVSIILYQMISGKFPFDVSPAMDPGDLEQLIKQGEVRPLPDEIPSDLGRIVMRSLQVNPKKRFQIAADLKKALEIFAASEAFKQWKQSAASRPRTSGEFLTAVVYDHRTKRILKPDELKDRFLGRVIFDRGERARRLLGAGRKFSPNRDAVADLVAERTAEG
jgi:serine/threonine protein kinase